MIHAENIIKSYNNGRTEVLKGVSLDVADGEFVTILGASGSGKSTLMNILSGLERADGGTVTVDGERLNDKTESELTAFRRRVTGFVFQQYYLLPHLNVLNNVRMGAALSNDKNDFMPLIEALGLKDKLKSMPSELSGGEQQRVCIARAIAKAPKILFLDEPTGALDEATGRGVLDSIAKERERLGFTAVMVTHNANIAEMSQTVIRLNSGKIVEKYSNAKQKTAYEIGW